MHDRCVETYSLETLEAEADRLMDAHPHRIYTISIPRTRDHLIVGTDDDDLLRADRPGLVLGARLPVTVISEGPIMAM